MEIVSASNAQDEQPLLSDVYYLERALAPFADVQKGTIGRCARAQCLACWFWPISERSRAPITISVARFVEQGGVLVRFAGARMTTNVDDLVPVKLRVGGRYLGSAMAWAQPQHLAPFPAASPFDGLSVPPEVTVSRQILAEPSVELAERSWARLADGTPLVTGAPQGKGWIVLFHVTASPAWSSLPLSGLYVDMLQRLLDLAGGARPASDWPAILQPCLRRSPCWTASAHRETPSPDVLPIRGRRSDKTRTLRRASARPLRPRGRGDRAQCHERIDVSLLPLNRSGTSRSRLLRRRRHRCSKPWLLAAGALALLLVDALISLWLRGYCAPAARLVARPRCGGLYCASR